MLSVVAAVVFIFVMVAVSMPVIPTIVMTVFVFSVMLFLVTGHIVAFIPVVLHEIDPFAAGVVFVAVLAPMFGMMPRYAQIDGRAISGSPLDHYRLTIDYAWCRIVTYVEPAIEARLADRDRDADVGSQCRTSDGYNGDCRCDKNSFHHVEPSFFPES